MYVGICLFAEATAGKLYEMTVQFLDRHILDLPPNYAFIQIRICHINVGTKYIAPARV